LKITYVRVIQQNRRNSVSHVFSDILSYTSEPKMMSYSIHCKVNKLDQRNNFTDLKTSKVRATVYQPGDSGESGFVSG